MTGTTCVHIQVDYRALSSRARTLLCGKLLPSAACFSINQVSLFRLSADIGFVDLGIYLWALYQLETLLYRGHHSEKSASWTWHVPLVQ